MGLGGDDELTGNGGPDVLDGGTGVDTASYAASPAGVSVNLAAGTGHGGDAEGDTLISIEHAIGSAFDDTFQGGALHGQFLAGDGNDTMIGGPVFDWFEGGNGNDTFIGTGGQTVMFGDDGDDAMVGSLTSNNSIYGGAGNDAMIGGNLTDWFYGAEGDDVVHGGDGDDFISDWYGFNRMYGEGGNDMLSSGSREGSLLDGGEGDDWIFSSLGGNTLIGGAGNDMLENQDGGATNYFSGGSGADTFVFRAGVSVDLHAVVTDYEDGVDHIGLRFENFDALAFSDSTDGAVITWYHSTMVLPGITASQITHDDFVLMA